MNALKADLLCRPIAHLSCSTWLPELTERASTAGTTRATRSRCRASRHASGAGSMSRNDSERHTRAEDEGRLGATTVSSGGGLLMGCCRAAARVLFWRRRRSRALDRERCDRSTALAPPSRSSDPSGAQCGYGECARVGQLATVMEAYEVLLRQPRPPIRAPAMSAFRPR